MAFHQAKVLAHNLHDIIGRSSSDLLHSQIVLLRDGKNSTLDTVKT